MDGQAGPSKTLPCGSCLSGWTAGGGPVAATLRRARRGTAVGAALSLIGCAAPGLHKGLNCRVPLGVRPETL